MPLYLCQPGTGKPEPWRHGISVYSTPAPVDSQGEPSSGERPLRRLRHGEIVLVDDVCLAWERHWLRLRWPGHRGGFAGYLPLEKSDGSGSQENKDNENDEQVIGEFLLLLPKRYHTIVDWSYSKSHF